MEIEAFVTERFPNLLYRVKVDPSKEDDEGYICYLAGKMRLRKISVIVGDRVRVKLDPAKGKATNRITYRL